MYVCMYVYVFMYASYECMDVYAMYDDVRVCTSNNLPNVVRFRACMHVCVFACMVCLHVCTEVCMYMYVCKHHTCIYVYVLVCYV